MYYTRAVQYVRSKTMFMGYNNFLMPHINSITIFRNMYEIRGTPYIRDVNGDVISREGSKTPFLVILHPFWAL